jgi:tRNA (mo5U34)-methyltransferase
MDTLRDRAEQVIKLFPEWYHSIELAPGVVTPGRRTVAQQEELLAGLDLQGKSVLDIGAFDGYFSFAAERMGASRVVALDHYVWSADITEAMKDWRESIRTGTLDALPALHESRHWRPGELPGRRPFDAARQILDSKVEPVVGDFMTMDLSSLGQFDVVLFLGVLYHLEEPLTALRKVRSLAAPGGLVVVQTMAVGIPGLENVAFAEFFPGRELNNDDTNWWAPSAKALEGMCKAAGFRDFAIVSRLPRMRRMRVAALKHSLFRSNKEYPRQSYSLIAHART